MDDQAARLRQLVRRTRQAAESANQPPVVLLLAANGSAPARQLAEQIESELGTTGEAPWQLARAFGPYSPAESDSWQAAAAVIVVLKPDNDAVLATYTALKLATGERQLPPLELVVVGDSEVAAAEAGTRLKQTCQRFLQCQMGGVIQATSDGLLADADLRTVLQRLHAVVLTSTGSNSLNPLAAIAGQPL